MKKYIYVIVNYLCDVIIIIERITITFIITKTNTFLI